MVDHATYMRNWRKARRPQPVPTLDWPTNLFGHPLAVDDLLRSDATYRVPKIGHVVKSEHLCTNPTCATVQRTSAPRAHNYAVSKVTGEAHTRRVLWFCHIDCKNVYGGVKK